MNNAGLVMLCGDAGNRTNEGPLARKVARKYPKPNAITMYPGTDTGSNSNSNSSSSSSADSGSSRSSSTRADLKSQMRQDEYHYQRFTKPDAQQRATKTAAAGAATAASATAGVVAGIGARRSSHLGGGGGGRGGAEGFAGAVSLARKTQKAATSLVRVCRY